MADLTPLGELMPALEEALKQEPRWGKRVSKHVEEIKRYARTQGGVKLSDYEAAGLAVTSTANGVMVFFDSDPFLAISADGYV